MKVTVDATRILHLIALIALSILASRILIVQWDWTPLSAFGCASTMVVQLSKALESLWTFRQEEHLQSRITNKDKDRSKKQKQKKR